MCGTAWNRTWLPSELDLPRFQAVCLGQTGSVLALALLDVVVARVPDGGLVHDVKQCHITAASIAASARILPLGVSLTQHYRGGGAALRPAMSAPSSTMPRAPFPPVTLSRRDIHFANRRSPSIASGYNLMPQVWSKPQQCAPQATFWCAGARRYFRSQDSVVCRELGTPYDPIGVVSVLSSEAPLADPRTRHASRGPHLAVAA